MREALLSEFLPAREATWGPRLGASLPLAGFYVGILGAVVDPTWATASMTLAAGSLMLSLMVAPIEYALGALACGFWAAVVPALGEWFGPLRWVSLAASTVVFSLRFFLPGWRGGRAAWNKVGILVAVFLVLSAGTLATSIAPALTAAKLAALISLFYVASEAGSHLVQTYGPAAPRRLLTGLLAYPLVLAVAPLLSSGLSLAPNLADNGRYVGLFGNPNVAGGLLAQVLVWAAAPLARRSSGWRLPLWVLAAALAALLYLLLLTVSRSSLLGVITAATLFGLIHGRAKVGMVLLLATGVFWVRALAEPGLVPRLVERYVHKQRSGEIERLGQAEVFASRRGPWATTQAHFREHPWWGLGFGVTNPAESEWTLGLRSERAAETGSSLWGTLVQVGVLGATPLFLAILLLMIAAGRFAWGVQDPSFTGLYGSTLLLAVMAGFDGWLIAPGSPLCVYFWIQAFALNAMICQFRPRPGVRQSGASPSTIHHPPSPDLP